MRHTAHLVLAAAILATPARADISNPTFAGPEGMPERIIPAYPERGLEGYAGPRPSGDTTATPSPDGTGTATGNPTGIPPGHYPTGDGTQTTAMTNMLAQSYGATAVTTSTRIGVNPNTVAAIGQAESNWRNVPTSNGTSAATGPWQIVPGTFTATSARYGLGYTAADINNPQAQAVVASYYVRETARTVTAATGQPATTLQTWNGYVFGPSNGAKIAIAPSEAPLRNIVPSSFISNNNLPADITVGELNTRYASRLGAAAYQPALTAPVGS